MSDILQHDHKSAMINKPISAAMATTMILTFPSRAVRWHLVRSSAAAVEVGKFDRKDVWRIVDSIGRVRGAVYLFRVGCKEKLD